MVGSGQSSSGRLRGLATGGMGCIKDQGHALLHVGVDACQGSTSTCPSSESELLVYDRSLVDGELWWGCEAYWNLSGVPWHACTALQAAHSQPSKTGKDRS